MLLQTNRKGKFEARPSPEWPINQTRLADWKGGRWEQKNMTKKSARLLFLQPWLLFFLRSFLRPLT
jgi:hypothetical protein